MGVPTNYFFDRKLHENERIWTPRGLPLDPPLIRNTHTYFNIVSHIQKWSNIHFNWCVHCELTLEQKVHGKFGFLIKVSAPLNTVLEHCRVVSVLVQLCRVPLNTLSLKLVPVLVQFYRVPLSPL